MFHNLIIDFKNKHLSENTYESKINIRYSSKFGKIMQLITLLMLLICASAINVDVDPLKTIVWGPGLKPAEVTVRARYFFLQLTDSRGRKLVLSINEKQKLQTIFYKLIFL